MLVSQLVANVKRLCQVGDVNVTNDQITSDIISFLNNRMYEFWRKHPWPWFLTPINIQTVIGQTDYNLPANIGDIIALQIGNEPSLKQLSIKEYFDWFLNNQIDPVTGLATVPANGNIENYVKIGDAAGNLQVRFWRPPSLAVVVIGFGKVRITTHAVADIAAGIAINGFPPETHPVLQDGVASDIYETAGQKNISDLNEKQFYGKIDEIKADLTIGQDDSQTTPPPDQYRWKKRQRGQGSTTVVIWLVAVSLCSIIMT